MVGKWVGDGSGWINKCGSSKRPSATFVYLLLCYHINRIGDATVLKQRTNKVKGGNRAGLSSDGSLAPLLLVIASPTNNFHYSFL